MATPPRIYEWRAEELKGLNQILLNQAEVKDLIQAPRFTAVTAQVMNLPTHSQLDSSLVEILGFCSWGEYIILKGLDIGGATTSHWLVLQDPLEGLRPLFLIDPWLEYQVPNPSPTPSPRKETPTT